MTNILERINIVEKTLDKLIRSLYGEDYALIIDPPKPPPPTLPFHEVEPAASPMPPMRRPVSFSREGIHYTELEDKRISDGFWAGVSDEKIASELGRTAAGIQTRRSTLGLRKRKVVNTENSCRRWSAEDLLKLDQHMEKGTSLDDIAADMKRSRDSIKHKMKKTFGLMWSARQKRWWKP